MEVSPFPVGDRYPYFVQESSLDHSNMPIARFGDRPDFIGRVLRDAFFLMMTELDTAIGAVHSEATPAINRALLHLDPDGTRIVELARRAGVTKQSMGEVVDRMVALGFVDVRPVPGPGRGKLVVATKAGWAALRDGYEAVTAIHRRWQALIGADEMAALVTALRHLIDEIRQSPPGQLLGQVGEDVLPQEGERVEPLLM
jgi:DNA-binding MarR family transcriptional regulator